jgi:hypothetical protein
MGDELLSWFLYSLVHPTVGGDTKTGLLKSDTATRVKGRL